MSADIGALFDERDSLDIAQLVKAGEVSRASSPRRRSAASRR